jgi:hypothetical protein
MTQPNPDDRFTRIQRSRRRWRQRAMAAERALADSIQHTWLQMRTCCPYYWEYHPTDEQCAHDVAGVLAACTVSRCPILACDTNDTSAHTHVNAGVDYARPTFTGA